jgi:transposase
VSALLSDQLPIAERGWSWLSGRDAGLGLSQSGRHSLIPAFANLVRRIEKHADAIIAAVELGLSNSRLESINAKIQLIQRRGYGFRNLDALTAAIYLCLGGVTVDLPTET